MANVRIKDQTARHTSGGLAGVQMAVDHPSWSSGRSMDLGLLGTAVYNVKSYGALGNNTGNDATAINAALSAAGAANGGIVFLPPGDYRCTSTILIPQSATKGVELIGSGMSSTNIRFPTDLGSGTYAIGASNREATNWCRVAHLGVYGPGTRVLGQPPCNMNGVQCNERWLLQRVSVAAFRNGIDLFGGHNEIWWSKSTNNYFGIYWSGQLAIGGGDHMMYRLFLDGNTLSSVGVATNSYIDSSTWIECHFGFSPYGFYRESPSVAQRPILSFSALIQAAFEACGNGFIYAVEEEGGHGDNRVYGNSFISSGGSWSNTYKLGSQARKAAITCNGFTRNHVEMWSGQFPSPYSGVTTAFISVSDFSENCFIGPDVLLGGAKPMAIGATGQNNWKFTRAGGWAQMVKNGANQWS